jgi:hypothetical protein
VLGYFEVFPPPPLPELNLSGMNLEELADLEGDERHNLEARIHCLRNINQLLDSAFVHIQQYYNITTANRYRIGLDFIPYVYDTPQIPD